MIFFRYSWTPLLNKNGKLIDEIVNLPIATNLASGYLSIQPLGLGKGVSVFFILSKVAKTLIEI
jgi:hypothetical protein